jgi:hypothetical protein
VSRSAIKTGSSSPPDAALRDTTLNPLMHPPSRGVSIDGSAPLTDQRDAGGVFLPDTDVPSDVVHERESA